MIGLTFLLAVVGYAGLTVTAIMTARGRLPVLFWRLTAAVMMTHVALVWTVRYDWSLAQATRNGYAGFLIFHTALALIFMSVFAPARTPALIYIVFAIVSLGALGAVFRYDEVAQYQGVVIALGVSGTIGITQGFQRKLRHG